MSKQSKLLTAGGRITCDRCQAMSKRTHFIIPENTQKTKNGEKTKKTQKTKTQKNNKTNKKK